MQITHSTAELAAAKAYDNPQCTSMAEFEDDLRRIRYVKRLLRKYKASGDMKEQLVLNHIIVLYNVFEARTLTALLFLKMDPTLYPALKTFLDFLHYMPELITDIEGVVIRAIDIPTDPVILARLQRL